MRFFFIIFYQVSTIETKAFKPHVSILIGKFFPINNISVRKTNQINFETTLKLILLVALILTEIFVRMVKTCLFGSGSNFC